MNLIPVKNALSPNAMSRRPSTLVMYWAICCDVALSSTGPFTMILSLIECCTILYWTICYDVALSSTGPSAVMLPLGVALPGPLWHRVSKLIGDLVHIQNQVRACL